MNAKQQRALSSLLIGTVIASVLVTIGCADGKRTGGKNSRVLRTRGESVVPPRGTPVKGGNPIANTPAGTNEPADAAPTLAVDKQDAEAEERINTGLAEMKSLVEGNKGIVAGEYTLMQMTSHAKVTIGSKIFAQAIAMTSYDPKHPASEPLSSGTFDGPSLVTELKLPKKLTFAVDGKSTSLPTNDALIRSTAERKGTKLVINEQPLNVNQATADSVSLVDLLNASGSMRTSKNKAVTASVSFVEGFVYIWMTIEEKTIDESKGSADSAFRNFFFVFANQKAQKAELPTEAPAAGN